MGRHAKAVHLSRSKIKCVSKFIACIKDSA
uniref:Uncharacterized protein n=1 Tax=Klebsiella phage FKP3 TaxID=3231233 RepID=A0AAU8HZC2_9CAUD